MDDQHSSASSKSESEECGSVVEQNSVYEVEHPGKICAVYCGFPVVKKTAQKFGMSVTDDENDQWTVFWTDRFPTYERCRLMKRHQKVNHIPGILSICRKDELAKNLNRMLKFFPKQYDFFPKTWVLPGELNGLLKYAKNAKNKIFILKPSRGSLGRGIYLTKTIEHLDLLKMMIGQVYIHRPFLIDGFKFDLRLYVLIASCSPLRVYVYNEGLARFATRKYEPSGNNLHVKYMHLTNYSLNKNSSTFVDDEIAGSKRKLSTVCEWLTNHNYNVVKVMDSIDDVVVKTILTSLPHMRRNYRACFPTHVDTVAGFELLGFDFILDHKLKPYLLEVNHTPSFTRCTPLDREIKDRLIYDVFRLLSLAEDESHRIIEDEKNFLHDRLNNRAKAQKLERDRKQELAKRRESWESEHLGDFRIVYPGKVPGKYRNFLKSLLGSPFEQEEEDLVQRKPRKNPYEFSDTLTNSSDTNTMRNLLFSSYRIFEDLHKDMAQLSRQKLIDEMTESRNNNWTKGEKFDTECAKQKALLCNGVKSVLKTISKRPDILISDKNKLSSIFLDPPTTIDNRESFVELSEDEEDSKKTSDGNPTTSDNISVSVSQVTKIEELDFIPGIVQESDDNNRDFANVQYKMPNWPSPTSEAI